MTDTRNKRTEVALIPEDWSNRLVGELITFQGGSQPNKLRFAHSRKSGYVRLIQIRDYRTDNFLTYIPESLARRFCNESDIMIGRYGPPIFQILRGLSGAYNVALIKAIPSNEINHLFAWYVLKQESLFSFVERLSQRSSGQTGVDLGELRNYPVALPSLAEQDVIAQALRDADALIESLEQLVAKKRLVKQAAMQELLTGKTRLPGFVGQWNNTQIGEIATVSAGGTPSRTTPTFWNGTIPWVTTTEIDGGVIRVAVQSITKEGLENSAARLYPPGTLLIALYGQGKTRGKVGVLGLEAATNQACAAIEILSDILPVYLFWNLSSRYREIREMSNNGNQENLNNQIVRSISISIPPLLEQTAISEVLSDMDAQIEALEARLAKARLIKQGMMQELLTGRIRLV